VLLIAGVRQFTAKTEQRLTLSIPTIQASRCIAARSKRDRAFHNLSRFRSIPNDSESQRGGSWQSLLHEQYTRLVRSGPCNPRHVIWHIEPKHAVVCVKPISHRPREGVVRAVNINILSPARALTQKLPYHPPGISRKLHLKSVFAVNDSNPVQEAIAKSGEIAAAIPKLEELDFPSLIPKSFRS
jgi:hypothetical protein